MYLNTIKIKTFSKKKKKKGTLAHQKKKKIELPGLCHDVTI